MPTPPSARPNRTRSVPTMRCLWLEAGRLELREIPRPIPVPGDALVRVTLAGICGTDLALLGGYYPYADIPGHEFVGVVESAPGAPHWEGKRVTGEINAACGRCPTCLAGRPTHCPNRTVLGIVNRPGAFAEYLCLPCRNLHSLPDAPPGALSDESAVFTEPVAAAVEVTEQVRIAPDHRVLVLGAGRLGQLLAQTLAVTGCTLTVAARYPSQQRALDARGLTAVSPDALPAAAFDTVVEATGSPTGFALALRAVRPRGTIVLKSTYPGEARVDLSAVVVDEVTLVGSRCGPFGPALRLLAQGLVDPTPLIEARYPLDDALEAFAHAARPGALKVLLQLPA